MSPEKTGAVKVPLGGRYWRLWGASVISNLGDGVGAIAFPWLASAVTRNPVLIALIAVAQRLPWLVFTLPAGVITDRLDRRRIMVWADVARAAFVSVIAAATSPPTAPSTGCCWERSSCSASPRSCATTPGRPSCRPW